MERPGFEVVSAAELIFMKLFPTVQERSLRLITVIIP